MKKSTFADVSKSHLYTLYWDMQKTIKEIADKHDVGKRTVRRYLHTHGIPVRQQQRDAKHYVLKQRPKQFWYEQYWDRDQSVREIADQLDVHHECVLSTMKELGVPRNHPSLRNKWYDKEHGVPRRYKQPRDEARCEDDNRGEMPEDPSPNDYLAETPLYRDKDRLYQLYWGYGLTKAAILARCDCTHSTLISYFRELGIPEREYRSHTRWEPHHGIPPKYEWPDDHEQSDSNDSPTGMDDYQQAKYLSPRVGDD